MGTFVASLVKILTGLVPAIYLTASSFYYSISSWIYSVYSYKMAFGVSSGIYSTAYSIGFLEMIIKGFGFWILLM